MNDQNQEAFIKLFREAYRKCFGSELNGPLSETESKHFGNQVYEATGLVIGAKSIKNYSVFISDIKESKPENPSVATLDTLARYVLNAPYTDELHRKEKESHYPYWFQYKSRGLPSGRTELRRKFRRKEIIFFLVTGVLLLGFIIYRSLPASENKFFIENFRSTDEDTLRNHGWMVKAKDDAWWKRRGERPGHLTLFTLPGDNWADSMNSPSITNLLIKRIHEECFTAEIHLSQFIPEHNWQQAGILLMEDSNFESRSLRLSIAYNDFFGGFARPGEIILQAIISNGVDPGKPEEMVHLPLFRLDKGKDSLVSSNLQHSALKIEKTGNRLRILYATGNMENFAFREALTREIYFHPKYVGIFALKGFGKDSTYLQVRVRYFSMMGIPCEEK